MGIFMDIIKLRKVTSDYNIEVYKIAKLFGIFAILATYNKLTCEIEMQITLEN